MKKSLIALAALAFVGAAAAQSSVTLYGKADLWVGKTKNGKIQAGDDGLAGSRWGIKGSEDLGGGLKANFNFEQGLDLSNGSTGAGFDRQANVGFSGSFGEIKLGKTWTPIDDIYGAANSGFDSKLSATNGVWKNNYTDTFTAQIYYATPEIAGFSGAASTQLKGNQAAAGGVDSFRVQYAAGAIYAGVAYQNDKATGTKNTLINGTYDLGMVKLLASYDTNKVGANKTNQYQLGADIPLNNALTLSVGYANSKSKSGVAYKADGFGVAAGYALSKRTMLYTGFRSNKTNGAKDSLYAVGVNHSF